MAETTRMTVAQAIVKFLDNQYVSMDGVETKFVEGFSQSLDMVLQLDLVKRWIPTRTVKSHAGQK